MKPKLSITLLALLSVIGCYSQSEVTQKVPGKDHKMPLTNTSHFVIASPMQGTLLSNGEPLANTRIIRTLRWNGNDTGLVQEFWTDELGRFDIPLYEQTLSLNFLDQFVAKTDLEVEINNSKHYLWSSSKFYPEVYAETNGNTGPLICDISSEELAIPMGPTSILTVCRWKDIPN